MGETGAVMGAKKKSGRRSHRSSAASVTVASRAPC